MSTDTDNVPAAVPAPVSTPAAPAENKKHILVVEDEKPLAHALEMKLRNEGYDVSSCMNGNDALQELKNKNYDLMLLDLIMPLMDGFAVLEEMKAQKFSMPVIVLSNLGQEEDRTKAKELGAVDYFVKSNTPISDIIKRVHSVV